MSWIKQAGCHPIKHAERLGGSYGPSKFTARDMSNPQRHLSNMASRMLKAFII